jgi:hypothetical protein
MTQVSKPPPALMVTLCESLPGAHATGIQCCPLLAMMRESLTPDVGTVHRSDDRRIRSSLAVSLHACRRVPHDAGDTPLPYMTAPVADVLASGVPLLQGTCALWS